MFRSLINIEKANHSLSAAQMYCELSVRTALSNWPTAWLVGQLLSGDRQNSVVSVY